MNEFMSAASPSGKFIKLKEKGDSITMEITDVSMRDFIPYGESTPKVNKQGKIEQEWLISGMDYSAESEDEAAVVLAVNKWAMKRAIGKALKDAGASEPQVGGTLTVTCDGDGVARKAGAYPPKAFSAVYHLPEPADNEWGAE